MQKLPRFKDDATVWFSGATWNKMAALLESWRPVAGRNLLQEGTPTGTLLHSGGGGGGGGLGGPFSTLYTKGGDTYLQGGSIQATDGGDSLEDYLVLSGGGLPSGVDEGDRLWIEVDVSAIKDDDGEAIIAGIELDSADYDRGANPPDNEFPGLTGGGTVVLEIGRWTETGFLPGLGGNFLLGACPGNFSVQRN